MKTLLRTALLGLCIAASANAAVIFDDFSDLNDTANPPWTHSSVLGSAPTWSAAGANYRLQSNIGAFGLGYVGSFVGNVLTDSSVQLDIVDWLGNAGQAFGLAGRAADINLLGGLDGYGFAYELNTGEFVLYRVTNASLIDLGNIVVALDPAKDYRLHLNITGTTINGQAFEIGGSPDPIANLTATDATYASGLSGTFGYSGGGQLTDYTIDNFTIVPEPGSALLLGLCGIGGLARRRR